MMMSYSCRLNNITLEFFKRTKEYDWFKNRLDSISEIKQGLLSLPESTINEIEKRNHTIQPHESEVRAKNIDNRESDQKKLVIKATSPASSRKSDRKKYFDPDDVPLPKPQQLLMYEPVTKDLELELDKIHLRLIVGCVERWRLRRKLASDHGKLLKQRLLDYQTEYQKVRNEPSNAFLTILRKSIADAKLEYEEFLAHDTPFMKRFNSARPKKIQPKFTRNKPQGDKAQKLKTHDKSPLLSRRVFRPEIQNSPVQKTEKNALMLNVSGCTVENTDHQERTEDVTEGNSTSMEHTEESCDEFIRQGRDIEQSSELESEQPDGEKQPNDNFASGVREAPTVAMQSEQPLDFQENGLFSTQEEMVKVEDEIEDQPESKEIIEQDIELGEEDDSKVTLSDEEDVVHITREERLRQLLELDIQAYNQIMSSSFTVYKSLVPQLTLEQAIQRFSRANTGTQ